MMVLPGQHNQSEYLNLAMAMLDPLNSVDNHRAMTVSPDPLNPTSPLRMMIATLDPTNRGNYHVMAMGLVHLLNPTELPLSTDTHNSQDLHSLMAVPDPPLLVDLPSLVTV